MKRVLLLCVCLVSAVPVSAQAPAPASSGGHPLKTHPEGAYTWGSKTVLASPADWQCLGGQTHRKVANGIRDTNPLDLGHDHDIICAPIGTEQDGSTDITVAVPLKLFQLDGDIISVTAEYNPACYERVHTIPVSMANYPVVGNPAAGALVESTAWYTFNVKDFLDVCVPLHGWFRINTKVTVRMHDGVSTHTTEVTVPYFSMLDPSAPEQPPGEGGVQTVVRTTNANFAGDPAGIYGIQYIELQHPFHLYGLLSQPTRVDPLAAAYSFNSNLPAVDVTDGTPLSLYRLMFGLDWHHGILGLDQTQAISPSSNGILFHDIIRPANLLSVPNPMGVPSGCQKVALGWLQGSGKNGFTAASTSPTDPGGAHIQGGEEIDTWLDYIVCVDPNWKNFDQSDPPLPDGNPAPAPAPAPNPTPAPTPAPVPPPPTTGAFSFTGRNLTLTAIDPQGYWFAQSFIGDASGPACTMTGQPPFQGPFYSPGGSSWAPIGETSYSCWGSDATGHQGGFQFTVHVSPMGTPPAPPTCQDPKAKNFGGPLPCVQPDPLPPPPPPPPVDWHSVTGVLQRLNNQIRICDPADGKCLVLGGLQ